MRPRLCVSVSADRRGPGSTGPAASRKEMLRLRAGVCGPSLRFHGTSAEQPASQVIQPSQRSRPQPAAMLWALGEQPGAPHSHTIFRTHLVTSVRSRLSCGHSLSGPTTGHALGGRTVRPSGGPQDQAAERRWSTTRHTRGPLGGASMLDARHAEQACSMLAEHARCSTCSSGPWHNTARGHHSTPARGHHFILQRQSLYIDQCTLVHEINVHWYT